MCVPWESNPQPFFFALLTQCSTTEPHRNTVLPLPLSFARSRESKGCPNSGFDRGVGVRGRGRYPLKPRIFTSLLETKSTQNTLRPDHPESIFILNNLFKITTVLFCALHSPVTYIYICNHALNLNVFKNRYFSTLTLHC